MPRLGKKTLYLDLDALERLEAALERFPGRPSVSSYLSEVLPQHAQMMEKMTEAMEGQGFRALANLFELVGEGGRELDRLSKDVKKASQSSETPDKPLSEMVAALPPKKVRKPRVKKVVEE